jgi:predicted deacetylase
MLRTDSLKTLCVSVHDVAPRTWPQCERLLHAIHAVAAIPVTLLVVPAYHHHAAAPGMHYERCLERRLACGDELALHGYTHLDEAAAPTAWRDKFTRTIYTRSEGEFYAIDAAEARRRLELGMAWFAQRHWPVEGFIAPAWLLGHGAWAALMDFPFSYTTTMRRFYLLPTRQALLSPSLVYTVRSPWRRWLSRAWTSMLCRALQDKLLVRLSLHPTDADHPRMVRHFQMLIEMLLVQRQAMTKASFAGRWRQIKEQGEPFNAGARPPPTAHTTIPQSAPRKPAC